MEIEWMRRRGRSGSGIWMVAMLWGVLQLVVRFVDLRRNFRGLDRSFNIEQQKEQIRVFMVAAQGVGVGRSIYLYHM